MNRALVSLLFVVVVLTLAGGCGKQSRDGMLATGRKYVAEHNYKGAIVVFKTMLEKYPHDREAQGELAWAYFESGKIDQAETLVQALLAEKRENRLVLLLGRVKLAQGKADEADALARDILKSQQDNAEAWELLGLARMAKGELSRAEESFHKAWSLSASRTMAKLGLVDIAQRQGDEDKVDKELGELLDASPNNQLALHLQARRFLAKGKYDQAISTYGKLIGLSGKDLRARYQEAFLRLMVRDDLARAQKVAPALIKEFPNQPEGYKLQGLIGLRLQEYSEAVNRLQTALKMRRDLDTHYFLAVTYDKSGKPELAISELNAVLDANPNDIQTRDVLVQVYLRQGRLEEAVQEARKALEINPKDMAASRLLGDALFAKRDYDQALRVFSRLAETEDKPSVALYKKGLVLLAKGDKSGAEAMFRESLANDPQQIAPRLLLAASLAKGQRFDDAMTLLSQGPDQGPDGAKLRVAMAGVELMRQRFDQAATLLAQARDIDPEAVEASIQLSTLKALRGDLEGALREYQLALGRHPENTRLLMGAAVVADALKRPKDARAFLERAKNTRETAGYLALASYLAKDKDLQGALVVIDQCLEEHPRSVQALRVKVRLLEDMGNGDGVLSALKSLETLDQPLGWTERIHYALSLKDYANARETAAKFIENQPKAAVSYLPMAQVLEAQGDLAGSERILRKALEEQPKSALATVTLANNLARQKRLPEALETCQDAVKLAPALPQPHLALGMIAQAMGHTAQAMAAYETVLKINPKQGEALNNLAMLYAEKPDTLARAGVLASSAYTVLGDQAPVLDTLGYVLFKQGRTREAVEILEKAAKLAPKNPEIAEHLARAQKGASQ